MFLQGRSTLTNGVTPIRHVHTILSTQFQEIPPKNYHRPPYRLDSGAPGGIWSIACGIKGREAPQRRTGRLHREGAPEKRWRSWGGQAGGQAPVRQPGEEGLREPLCPAVLERRHSTPPVGSGYLATRRHPSQQALHLTHEVGDYEAQHAPRPRRADYKSHNAPPTLSSPPPSPTLLRPRRRSPRPLPGAPSAVRGTFAVTRCA